MNVVVSKLPLVVRSLLGAMFVFSGLNGFFQFVPAPPMPAAAGALLGAFAAAGYLFPLIKGTELLVGLLLLSGRFVPLALTVLAPVLINIVIFHAVLAPAGLPIPLVLMAAEIYLAWTQRDAFAPLFQPKTVTNDAPAIDRSHLATAS
jgi:putative oxidoreductase